MADSVVDLLSRVRVVLVETSHPANIGAAARAMKTMGLSQLTLVRPQLFPHAEATALASGADDLLAAARVCDSLAEAVADCRAVYGTSARLRALTWPQLDPRGCAARIAAAVADPEIEVALVFGRERSGLTNEELALCNYLVTIPTNPGFGVLNVSASVQVLCYEIAVAAGIDGEAPRGQKARVGDAGGRPATADEIEGFYGHLEQALIEFDYLDPANPRQLMRRLRRLFNRAELSHEEVNILRGVLKAAQRAGAAGRELR